MLSFLLSGNNLKHRRRIRWIAPLALILYLVFAATTSHAAGLFKMPSTFCQMMGWGFGPGYHAPMVVGAQYENTWCQHNMIIQPYAPGKVPCQAPSCQASQNRWP